MPSPDGTIAIIGLGYVGLPLAVEFAKKRRVIGFDIGVHRVEQLKKGIDATLEVGDEELQRAGDITFTSNPGDLIGCNIFIVTVPTPIDEANRPDLGPLISASRTVGEAMSKGSYVIYESTVYPGCTRGICMPLLEKHSGLKFNEDFFVGYSPERINPGDHQHRLPSIKKVTSGSTSEAADAIDGLYASIITAGTHKATSLEVAEAAKVIENTQRDLNIALMNELSLIFGRLNIDTLEVLEAAGTKWNFVPFRPGLVGGHCIGVDPYYLTHRAQEVGYHPEVILAGRRINDRMGMHAADSVATLMMRKRIPVVGSRVLVMGVAFKENCPDMRNSKAVDIVRRLCELNAEVVVWDPWVNEREASVRLGVPCSQERPDGRFDAIVIAVPHREFVEMGAADISAICKPQHVIYDIKGMLDRADSDGRF